MKKKAIRRKLNTILIKLETMQCEIEEMVAGQGYAKMTYVPGPDPDTCTAGEPWHWDPERQQFVTGPES